MNVLVTGGTGFIGSHLVNRLKEDHNMVILRRDCFQNEWQKDALKGVTKVRGDILDFPLLKRVLVEYHIHQVYHLAATSIVSNCLKYPIQAFNVNVIGTVKLLEACKQTEVDKILVMITDKVYGNQMEATEESPLSPIEPYSGSKICQDVAAETFTKTYGLKTVRPRCCNVYGYDPRHKRIVSNTIKSCLLREPPIIFKGEEGLRQYIFVEDAVNALIKLMKGDYQGVYNITTVDILTQEQVVNRILEFFPKLEPKYVTREKPVEIQKQSMDSTKGLMFQKHSFYQGIEKTIEKFQKYKEDWL